MSSIEVLDDVRLNQVFELAAMASEAWPLPRVLRGLCERVAGLLDAEVTSLYLRESEMLVMRANVGFPDAAVGNVCLGIGEGITGFAAECMRPVRRDVADRDDHYKLFDGLGEERYPAFLAWPLLHAGRVVGVLVLQRSSESPFTDRELESVGALSNAFLLAIETAAHRHTRAAHERGESEGREVRLHGRSAAPGLAVGRAEPLASLDELVGDTEDESVEAALKAVTKQLDRGVTKFELQGETRERLERIRLVLDDARFQAELHREVEERGVAGGLASIARRYALTALRTAGADDWLEDRASEVAALCRLVAAQVAGRPLCRPGGVLVLPERPGSLLALEAAMRRATGVVVGDPMPAESVPTRILQHAGIPAVSEVAGLFDWVRAGDPLLVDGDAGVLWVNPSEAQIARTRA